MGAFVPPMIAFHMEGEVNLRFAEGDPIAEMAALQAEFGLFNPEHSLRSAAAILGLAPLYGEARLRWFDYMDYLDGLDVANSPLGLRETLRQNLESGDVRPVHFQYHGSDNPVILVTPSGGTVPLSSVSYLHISVPVQSYMGALRVAKTAAPPSAERREGRRKSGSSTKKSK
ncbi:hypothetical protein LRS03_18315 [Rhizobacter sp. J219]|uniref:hypothetical protein n=1 Tax=Rhizobacter sp. J219 TaxID=2898430 RepID=UPI0021517BA9|nr:hypothetical protein [Rhizobacter sp. J219]MCR5884697.1 hypothetical protein [Rhizobacter sp. J219]